MIEHYLAFAESISSKSLEHAQQHQILQLLLPHQLQPHQHPVHEHEHDPHHEHDLEMVFYNFVVESYCILNYFLVVLLF